MVAGNQAGTTAMPLFKVTPTTPGHTLTHLIHHGILFTLGNYISKSNMYLYIFLVLTRPYCKLTQLNNLSTFFYMTSTYMTSI